MPTTLEWQKTGSDFWTAGRSRIYQVDSALYLAAVDGRWLKATFPSWLKAADAVQLTLECQPEKPDDEPLPLPQSRNFLVPGCTVEIHSEDPQPIGRLLTLVFAISQSNPTAEVSFSLSVREP